MAPCTGATEEARFSFGLYGLVKSFCVTSYTSVGTLGERMRLASGAGAGADADWPFEAAAGGAAAALVSLKLYGLVKSFCVTSYTSVGTLGERIRRASDAADGADDADVDAP